MTMWGGPPPRGEIRRREWRLVILYLQFTVALHATLTLSGKVEGHIRILHITHYTLHITHYTLHTLQLLHCTVKTMTIIWHLLTFFYHKCQKLFFALRYNSWDLKLSISSFLCFQQLIRKRIVRPPTNVATSVLMDSEVSDGLQVSVIEDYLQSRYREREHVNMQATVPQ